jgi:hypothetical protein
MIPPWAEAAGYAAAAMSITSASSQFIRFVRVCSAQGVAISISAFLWFLYGVGAGEVPVFVNSFMQTILSSTVAFVLIARPMALQTAGDADLVAGRIGDVEVALAPDRI